MLFGHRTVQEMSLGTSRFTLSPATSTAGRTPLARFRLLAISQWLNKCRLEILRKQGRIAESSKEATNLFC